MQTFADMAGCGDAKQAVAQRRRQAGRNEADGAREICVSAALAERIEERECADQDVVA
jgi:hypothetical protein